MHVEQIADACPTFSWGGIPGATGYELEVFVLNDEDALGERVIQQELSGNAYAWTPPLRGCLSRATSYAWSVGAITKTGTIWSDPALFQVASGYSESEFQEALRVVRSYFETNEEGNDQPAEEPASSRPAQSETVDKSDAEVKPVRRKGSGSFAIDGVGNVMASAFIGDGTLLTGVNADTLDSKDSTEFLLATGGTITGDLIIDGSLTAPTLILNGENFTSVTEPTVYVPAFLTCGTNAESNSAQWASLASGTFRITLESTAYDVVVSFVGAGNMDAVATKIQDAINTATSGSETVTWDTDHFIVSSGDTTGNSSIAALETHGSATPIDISGAGTNDWMDCDSGNGVGNLTRINLPFYEGSLVRLNSEGIIDPLFIAPEIKTGVDQFFANTPASSKTIMHNLGRIPRRIRIRWYSVDRLSDTGRSEGEGIYNGTDYATIYEYAGGTPAQFSSFRTDVIIAVDFEPAGAANWNAVIGEMDEDSFTLNISYWERLATVYFLWEVM